MDIFCSSQIYFDKLQCERYTDNNIYIGNMSSGQGGIPDWRSESASADALIRCDTGTNSIVWMKEDVSVKAQGPGAKPALQRNAAIYS